MIHSFVFCFGLAGLTSSWSNQSNNQAHHRGTGGSALDRDGCEISLSDEVGSLAEQVMKGATPGLHGGGGRGDVGEEPMGFDIFQGELRLVCGVG